MPSLSSNRSPVGIAAAVAVTVLMAIVLFGSPAATAETIGEEDVQWGWGVGEGPAGDYDFPSDDCTGNHTDPVGVLFIGKRAGVTSVQRHIEIHNRWDAGVGDTGSNHSLFVRNDEGGLECKEMDASSANADDASDRMHVRLWHIPATESPQVMTVGTPHHEDFVVGNGCNTHAVDPNGSVGTNHGPNASGFDWARHELKWYFSLPNSWHPSHFPQHYGGRHHVETEYWGNSANFTQCTGKKAGSDGFGVVIWINRKTDPRTQPASASQSNATLLGGFQGDGTTNEWWFGYGTKSAQGPSGYQKTTSVKTSSAVAEVSVNAPVSDLKPNTRYYARLFIKTAEGEVEEGDEVAFTTQAPPIAAYSFDAGEGTLAEDSAGGHDGTIKGAQWVRGKFGGSLSFDGENDCISVPESAQLQFLEDEEFTLEAWVRPKDGEEIQAIVTQEDDSAAEEERPFSYSLLVGGEEPPKGWLRKSGESGHIVVAEGEPLPLNAWSHIAFVNDGATLRFYVNGELSAERSTLPLAAAEGPLTIGCLDNMGIFFDGRIDEVRVYDRALEAGEVATDRSTPIVTPRAGPVAAYSFDRGQGQIADDLVGEHHGTIKGAQWVRGKFGGSLSFDGENDCISVPESAQLQFLEDEEFTLEAWVRPKDGEEIQAIVTQEDDSAAEEERPFSYSLLVGGEEPPKGWLRKSGESGHIVVAEGEPLPLNAWSHIAFVNDGATLRFYVNGELSAERSTLPLAAAEGPLTIGCLDNMGIFFDGRIDEVRVYDRALEAGEVATDRSTPIVTPQAPPIAAYSFDAGEGTLAEDSAGGHDGTIKGAQWVRGKFGGSLSFDGENDCISVPESAQLQFLEDEEFTLEAWVRPKDGEEIQAIVTQEDDSAAEEERPFSYSLLVGGEEPPKGWLRKSGESGHIVVAEGEPLPLNAWSHIAFVNDGATLRFYVNGELSAERSTLPLAAAEGPLTIGCLDNMGIFFDGRIDEVRVYDRALEAGEVATDRSTPIVTPRAGPVAAYSFDRGQGQIADDLVGEHHGTIKGAQWVRGKFGGSLSFDGENDCISVPESAQLQFLEDEEFTLEAWVRPKDGEEIQAIVTQEDDSAAEEERPFSYSLLVGGEEPPKGWLRKSGESGHIVVAEGEPLPLNAWSHIAFVNDGATLRFYVNGELSAERSTLPLAAAEGPLTIGCLDNMGIFFDGRIDEVRVYDRALEAGEVATDKGSPIEG